MKSNTPTLITSLHLLSIVTTNLLLNTTPVSTTPTPCPKMCSGHGTCGVYGVCTCLTGFTGADCSLRLCPSSTSWSDVATANDVAHRPDAECSDRGLCDRDVAGACVCETGFEGVACERKSCYGDCSGRGRCVSAALLSRFDDGGLLRKDDGGCLSDVICVNDDCSERDYGKCFETYDYKLPWDATKMQGCVCDEGYEGYDCSVRTCAVGDDPLTGTEESEDGVQVNEMQLIECTATFGSFTLTFRGETTRPIPHDANVFDFVEIFSALPSLRKGSDDRPIVAVEWLSSSETVCSATGNDIQLTFLQNFGDLSLVLPNGSNLGHLYAPATPPLITVQKLIRGTKESDVCSNRGTCDRQTGVCICLPDWMTSDGYGDAGTRGDCGYLSRGTTSTCPGEPACLGLGTCSGPPDYRCECQKGRTGADCALFQCPQGKSWFSFPRSGHNMAHERATCSDMGICDEFTGECDCAEGFTGAACDIMTCPGRPLECHGNGECLNMATLATRAQINGDPVSYTYGSVPNDHLRWDFDQVRGCYCSSGWEGYDCSLKSCPKGDDPNTPHQFNEVQTITCTTDFNSIETPNLQFTFRGETTITLQSTHTAQDLEHALNQISSISKVSATYADSSIYEGAVGLDLDALQICRSSTTQVINIEFLSPTGNVPLIKLVDDTNIDGISIMETIPGTKEYRTCSGRGLCNHSNGLCECFIGYASSDGQGGPGLLGDCGYRSPVELERAEIYY